MSAGSFKLSKGRGRWWADGKFDSGRVFHWDLGPDKLSKEKAETLAEVKYDRSIQMGKIAREHHDRRRAAARAPAAAPPPPPPASASHDAELPDDLDEQLEAAEADPPPPPTVDEPRPASSPERSQEIALKLRGLGDGRPIDPDGVHGSPEAARAAGGADEADEVDEEAGELIAELIASGVIVKNVAVITKALKKAKPPKRPGNGPEKMREWYHAGMVYNLKKLVGKATAMGPTGKMFVGALLFNAAMLWNAEEIEPSEASSSPPAAAAAPPAPAATAPDVPTEDAAPAEGAPAAPAPLHIVKKQTSDALGTFK